MSGGGPQGGGGRFRGRGGGDFRGGSGFRGGGRGASAGYRDDRGGRGGGYRGGRGGGRGGVQGGTPSEDDGVFGRGDISPPYDQVVYKIENDFVKELHGAGSMAGLKLTDEFPYRPSHGTQGIPIIVFANFFKISCNKGFELIRYNVSIKEIKNSKSSEANLSRKKKKRLFEILLEDRRFRDTMTDFAAFMISPQRLPDVGTQGLVVRIAYKKELEDDAAPGAPQFDFLIQEQGSLPIDVILEYLKATNPNATIPMRDETLQALNVVANQWAQLDAYTMTTGQNKFFSIAQNDNNSSRLGKGLMALRGIFKSVRPATGRLLLNVNVAHSVVYEPGLLPVLMDSQVGRVTTNLDRSQLSKVEKFIKFVRVSRTHLTPRRNNAGQNIPGIKTIWGFANITDGRTGAEHRPQVAKYGAGPTDVKFWFEEPVAHSTSASAGKKGKAKTKTPKPDSGGAPSPIGRYISVFDYFKLKHPNVQLDTSRPVVNVGNRENPTYLPADVCKVLTGQSVGRKLDGLQTAAMVKFACRKPKANLNFITTDARTALGLDPPSNTHLVNYGMSIEKSLITVPARVLRPPNVNYMTVVGDGKLRINPATPKDGSWNLGGTSFSKSGAIRNWSYINLQWAGVRVPNEQDSLPVAMGKFMQTLASMGVNIPTKAVQAAASDIVGDARNPMFSKADIIAAFRKAHNQKVQFLLVLLPARHTGIYNLIKTIGDLQAGILTVCVVRDKFLSSRGQVQYFANVAMKFNLKAGGTNSTLDEQMLGIISQGRTMVVGIDVTHPQPGASDKAPSVAGMVASIDKTLGQWPAILSTQKGRQEMVAELEAMFKSRLQLWYKHNGKAFPDNILVYRDGVSEGQYRLVLDQELPALRNAAKALYPAHKQKQGLPNITIIVVGKRHHTRFYPTRTTDAHYKTFNCMPGTIVDRGVVEVRNWDFFLQAHHCLQGTARPAHYYVILDEIFRNAQHANNLGPRKNAVDALEDLTHNMCHLFGRATKAVSICPPAYYADLVCERARAYLTEYYDPETPNETPAGSVAGDAGDATSQAAATSGMVTVHESLRDIMFYI